MVGGREGIDAAVAQYRKIKTELYHEIEDSEEFKRLGGKIYPYDILDANLDALFKALDDAGLRERFENSELPYVSDIGCANGDLSIVLSQSGLHITGIDHSHLHDRAPFVVSRLAERLGLDLAVADISVDGPVTFSDIKRATLRGHDTALPSTGIFDLSICFGLIYHLKNPFAFLESLAMITRYAVVGTHVMTHLPGEKPPPPTFSGTIHPIADYVRRIVLGGRQQPSMIGMQVDGFPLAYLLEPFELNWDPSNFWVLTEKAFHRLLRRCGFEILAAASYANNPYNVAIPHHTKLGVRNVAAVRSLALTT
jgi:tRNA (mo5U34)-methyltransferase